MVKMSKQEFNRMDGLATIAYVEAVKNLYRELRKEGFSSSDVTKYIIKRMRG